MFAVLSLILTTIAGTAFWSMAAGPSQKRFRWAAGVIIGPTLSSVLIYALYYLFARWRLDHPLLWSNVVIHALILLALLVILRLRPTPLQPIRQIKRQFTTYQHSPMRRRFHLLTSFTLILTFIFAYRMTWGSYFFDGAELKAGLSVFSDFAPHTAMMRSFSQGLNIPTEYAHFAGDGIAHHFLFFFMCGNLNALGLPLSWAINLPTVVAFVVLAHLLGSLAIKITHRRLSYFIAPMLVWFRSSLSWWTWLKEVRSLSPEALAAYPELQTFAEGQQPSFSHAWGIMTEGQRFVGTLPRDDWGLFASNVYANQRHLIWSLCLMLLIIFLWLPSLRKGFLDANDQWIGSFQNFFHKKQWTGLPRGPLLISLSLLITFPYWHGSTLIVLLVVLFFMALRSRHKLAYVLMALTSILSSLALTAFFQGQAARTIHPTFLWGFLLGPEASIPQIFAYLFTLFGFGFILMLVLPPLQDNALAQTLSVPLYVLLIFAFTVSLTSDVTVNHKYLMLSYFIATPMIAGFLAGMFEWGVRQIRRNRRKTESLQSTRHLMKGALSLMLATLMGFLLTVNGWIDLKTYGMKNKQQVAIPTDSAFVQWLENETRPDSVFITPSWAYHSFFYSGRLSYYGHSYYAWSAGHDTFARLEQQNRWLSGTMPTEVWTAEAVQQGIDYLIVTDSWLQQTDPAVVSPHHTEGLTVVATFPEEDNMVIYKLS